MYELESVDPLPSGEVIESADIEAMHESVRAIINSMQPPNIGPRALGPQHLPSIVHLFNMKKVTTDEIVNTTPVAFTEDPADILAFWQVCTNYVMDNSGSGFTLPPCILIVWASVFVRDVNPVPASTEWDTQLWLNLGWSKDGVDDISALESRCLFPETDLDLMSKQVTIFKVHDFSGEAGDFVIDNITLRGATNPASTFPVAAPEYTIGNGNMGIIALYRQS